MCAACERIYLCGSDICHCQIVLSPEECIHDSTQHVSIFIYLSSVIPCSCESILLSKGQFSVLENNQLCSKVMLLCTEMLETFCELDLYSWGALYWYTSMVTLTWEIKMFKMKKFKWSQSIQRSKCSWQWIYPFLQIKSSCRQMLISPSIFVIPLQLSVPQWWISWCWFCFSLRISSSWRRMSCSPGTTRFAPSQMVDPWMQSSGFLRLARPGSPEHPVTALPLQWDCMWARSLLQPEPVRACSWQHQIRITGNLW